MSKPGRTAPDAQEASDSLEFGLSEMCSEVSEGEVERLRFSCLIPRGVTLRRPGENEGPLDAGPGGIAVHVASIEAGLRFPMAPAVRRFLSEAPLHPLQFTGKGWQSLIGHIVLWRNKYGDDPSIEV